jgi:hypothetical protein
VDVPDPRRNRKCLFPEDVHDVKILRVVLYDDPTGAAPSIWRAVFVVAVAFFMPVPMTPRDFAVTLRSVLAV